MKYCDHCHCVVEESPCPYCGKHLLRDAENGDYCLLTEKEEIWAKLFMEVLENNHIPYTSLPILGAGVVIHAGKTERYQIYVPYDSLLSAKELYTETFPEEAASIS